MLFRNSNCEIIKKKQGALFGNHNPVDISSDSCESGFQGRQRWVQPNIEQIELTYFQEVEIIL